MGVPLIYQELIEIVWFAAAEPHLYTRAGAPTRNFSAPRAADQFE
jgi:hypothetical protein